MATPAPGARFAPFDLAWAIERLSDRLPRAVGPSPAIDAAIAFARRLPPIFHWGVLETRLVGPRDRVDVLPAVVRTGREHDEVGTHLSGRNLDPALQACLPILRPWARGETALWPSHVLWFEWDAPFTQPVPLILPSIEPTFWGPDDQPVPDVDVQVSLARVAYAAAHGETMPEAYSASLTRWIVALDGRGQAIAVTRTRPRGTEGYRLFAAIPAVAVKGWLERIRWPGDFPAMESWLDVTVPWWENAFLQVEMDAEGRTTPYLGIEPKQSSTHAGDARFTDGLLQHLVSQGMVDAQTVEQVLAWPALGSVVRDGVTLEEHTTVHLKVVLRQDQSTEVKAYFGFHYEH